MKNLKIFSSLLSANGRKVQAVCCELEIDVAIEEINVYSGEGNEQKYLKINPLGQIPTLSDDQITLIESNAILVYLSEEYGDNILYGSTPNNRAEVNRWLFWECSQWQPLITRIVEVHVGHKVLPEIVPAPKSGPDWGIEQGIKQLGLLENVLADRIWLTGRGLTLADYSVAAMTTYFKVSEFPFKSYPNISAWLDRLSEKDAWQKTEHQMWQ